MSRSPSRTAPSSTARWAALASVALVAGLALGCSTAQADERTDALVAEAQAMAAEGDLLRAAELLRRGADDEQRSSEDRARLFEEAARQYAAVGRPRLALASAERALKLAPSEDRRFVVAKLSDVSAQQPPADAPFSSPGVPLDLRAGARFTTATVSANSTDREWKALREILLKHGVDAERVKRVEEDFRKRQTTLPRATLTYRDGLTRWSNAHSHKTAELHAKLVDVRRQAEALRKEGRGEDHPDVVHLRDREREVRAALSAETLAHNPAVVHFAVPSQGDPLLTSVQVPFEEAKRALDAQKREVEALKVQFTEAHPKLVEARRRLTEAEVQLERLSANRATYDALRRITSIEQLRQQISLHELRLAEMTQSKSDDDAAVQALRSVLADRRNELARLEARGDDAARTPVAVVRGSLTTKAYPSGEAVRAVDGTVVPPSRVIAPDGSPIATVRLDAPQAAEAARLRDRLTRAEKQIEELRLQLRELLEERAGEDR